MGPKPLTIRARIALMAALGLALLALGPMADAQTTASISPAQNAKSKSDSKGDSGKAADPKSKDAYAKDTKSKDAKSKDKSSKDTKSKDTKSKDSKAKDSKSKDARSKDAKLSRSSRRILIRSTSPITIRAWSTENGRTPSIHPTTGRRPDISLPA